MHRILLHEVVIDVPTDVVSATQDFWATALQARPQRLEGHSEFIALHDAASRPGVGVQDVGSDSPRVHLDIESDDVDAEVARLVSLGATEVARPHSWVVLRDPAGLLFCVVPAESPDFGERARSVE